MKKSGLAILLSVVTFLFCHNARAGAATDGTPMASYEEFIGLVESNRILAVQYSATSHCLTAQQISDQATNELTCVAPWFGGALDPLLQRLLRSHHVAVTVETPPDDRWAMFATTAGWLLVPLGTLILLIVMYVRQTKIIKKLDA